MFSAVSAVCLFLLATAPVEAAETTTDLSGVLQVEFFQLDQHALAVDDLTVVAPRGIHISGVLEAAPGVSIVLRSGGPITIDGAVLAGDGEDRIAGVGTILQGMEGGAGGDLVVEALGDDARLILADDAILRAGDGGDGQSVSTHGTDLLAHAAARGGDGGDGGDVDLRIPVHGTGTVEAGDAGAGGAAEATGLTAQAPWTDGGHALALGGDAGEPGVVLLLGERVQQAKGADGGLAIATAGAGTMGACGDDGSDGNDQARTGHSSGSGSGGNANAYGGSGDDGEAGCPGAGNGQAGGLGGNGGDGGDARAVGGSSSKKCGGHRGGNAYAYGGDGGQGGRGGNGANGADGTGYGDHGDHGGIGGNGGSGGRGGDATAVGGNGASKNFWCRGGYGGSAYAYGGDAGDGGNGGTGGHGGDAGLCASGGLGGNGGTGGTRGSRGSATADGGWGQRGSGGSSASQGSAGSSGGTGVRGGDGRDGACGCCPCICQEVTASGLTAPVTNLAMDVASQGLNAGAKAQQTGSQVRQQVESSSDFAVDRAANSTNSGKQVARASLDDVQALLDATGTPPTAVCPVTDLDGIADLPRTPQDQGLVAYARQYADSECGSGDAA